MDRKAFFQSIKSPTVANSFSADGNPQGSEIIGKKPLNRRTNTGTNAYTGTFGKDELMHLLRRTLFGVKLADYNQYKGKTLEQVVDALLNVSSTLPNPPINNYGNLVNDPNVPYGSTWVNAALDPAVS